MKSSSYLDQLIADCKAAQNAVCVQQMILTSEMTLANIDIPAAIYIIREKNGDAKYTFECFKQFKNQQSAKKEKNKSKPQHEKEKVLACPKLNHPSEVLYVGSSTTGLRARLSQHTSYAHHDTYALRLNEWFKGDYEIEIRVYEEQAAVLQLIEDDLAFRLKPAFGKRGSNR